MLRFPSVTPQDLLLSLSAPSMANSAPSDLNGGAGVVADVGHLLDNLIVELCLRPYVNTDICRNRTLSPQWGGGRSGGGGPGPGSSAERYDAEWVTPDEPRNRPAALRFLLSGEAAFPWTQAVDALWRAGPMCPGGFRSQPYCGTPAQDAGRGRLPENST